MGRNNTRITVAKLGQKVDDGFKVMVKSLDELKEEVKGIQGCISKNELAIRTIDTNFVNHLGSHKRDITLVTIFISVLAIATGALLHFM